MTVGTNVGSRLHGMEKSTIVVQMMVATRNLGAWMKEEEHIGTIAQLADIKVCLLIIQHTFNRIG